MRQKEPILQSTDQRNKVSWSKIKVLCVCVCVFVCISEQEEEKYSTNDL